MDRIAAQLLLALLSIWMAIPALAQTPPFAPPGSGALPGTMAPVQCTVSENQAGTCSPKLAGVRIVITDGASATECGNAGDTGAGAYENVCRWSETAAAWVLDTDDPSIILGPAAAIDENVPIFDGTTGKLLKDSGYPVTADNVTDDNVESMTTAGAADTVPRSQGGGTLLPQPVYTKSEVDALFAASVPWDAVGTYVTYLADLGYAVYSDYNNARHALCVDTDMSELSTSDPLGEWTKAESTFVDAPNCNGGGATDDALGFCWTPDGWDSWDATFHATSIDVGIAASLHLFVGESSAWNEVVGSIADISVGTQECTCSGGCDTPGETCSLTLPEVADGVDDRATVMFHGEYWGAGTGDEGDGSFFFEVELSPGECVGFFAKLINWDAGSVSDPPYKPDAIFPYRDSTVSVFEMGARSDRPRICAYSTSAAIGGRCLDNAVVLMTGTGAKTFTLEETPSSPVGNCAMFINQGGATLTLTPDSADTIEGESQGASIQNATQYDKVQLCNFVSAFWNITGKTGTW